MPRKTHTKTTRIPFRSEGGIAVKLNRTLPRPKLATPKAQR